MGLRTVRRVTALLLAVGVATGAPVAETESRAEALRRRRAEIFRTGADLDEVLGRFRGILRPGPGPEAEDTEAPSEGSSTPTSGDAERRPPAPTSASDQEVRTRIAELLAVAEDRGGEDLSSWAGYGKGVEGIVGAMTYQDDEGRTVYPLRALLLLVLDRNLELGISGRDLAVAYRRVEEDRAAFDPTLSLSLGNRDARTQTSSAFSIPPVNDVQSTIFESALTKVFREGQRVSARFSFERFETNQAFEGLVPQYRSNLIVEYVMPLLEDRGSNELSRDLELRRVERNLAALGLERSAQDVAARAGEIYFDLSGAIEVLRLRQASEVRASELLEGNRQRLDAGIARINDIQQAQAAVASRQERTIGARTRVAATVDVLMTALRIRQTQSDLSSWGLVPEPLPRPEAWDAPELPALFGLAREEREDRQAALLEVERQDVELVWERNQRHPRLDLTATMGLNGLAGTARTVSFAGRPPALNPFGGSAGSSLGNLASLDYPEYFVGIQYSIPLGQRAGTARVAAKRAEREKAVMQLEQVEDQIELECRQALRSLRDARDRLAVAGEFVRLARTALDQEQELLARGLTTTFQVLELEDDLTDAEVRRIEALVDFHQARVKLGVALGVFLESLGLDVRTSERI